MDLDAGSTPVAEWAAKEGVSLDWADPREPACVNQAGCDDGANATCRVDPQSPAGSTVKRCFCDGGFRWDSIAGLCAYSKWLTVMTFKILFLFFYFLNYFGLVAIIFVINGMNIKEV